MLRLDAEEEGESRPVVEGIPILVETNGDAVRVDEELCRRGSCEMRVTPGWHHVTREVMKDGAWVTDFSTDVEIRFASPQSRADFADELLQAGYDAAMASMERIKSLATPQAGLRSRPSLV